MRRVLHPCQGTEHQRSAGRGNRAAPIAVVPVAKRTETNRDEKPSRKGPLWSDPLLQHPTEGGAHRGHAEPDSYDRFAED